MPLRDAQHRLLVGWNARQPFLATANTFVIDAALALFSVGMDTDTGGLFVVKQVMFHAQQQSKLDEEVLQARISVCKFLCACTR